MVKVVSGMQLSDEFGYEHERDRTIANISSRDASSLYCCVNLIGLFLTNNRKYFFRRDSIDRFKR